MKTEDIKNLAIIGAIVGAVLYVRNKSDAAADVIAEWWVGESEVETAGDILLPNGQRVSTMVMSAPTANRQWSGNELLFTYNGRRYKLTGRDDNGDFLAVYA